MTTTAAPQHLQLPDGGGYRQWFIYRDSGDRTWQVRIVEFCIRKPRCPYDVNQWMRDQLVAAGQRVALPAVLVLVGGWLLGVGARADLKIWTTRRRTRKKELAKSLSEKNNDSLPATLSGDE